MHSSGLLGKRLWLKVLNFYLDRDNYLPATGTLGSVWLPMCVPGKVHGPQSTHVSGPYTWDLLWDFILAFSYGI